MATISEALAIALAQYRHGRLDLAEEICRRILQAEPEQAEALHLSGLIASQAGRPAAALEPLGRAIAASPSRADFHNTAANALKDLGRLDEAIAAYRRAVELKPDFAEAHNNLGNALRRRGRLDEAAACCRRAIELRPELAEAHNNLGNALLDQGQLDEAAAAYQRAIELRPDYAGAYNNLGNAFRRRGRPDEAAACCQRAVQLRPDASDLLSNLLCTLRYHPGVTPAALGTAHGEFDRRFGVPLQAEWRPHAVSLQPDRPLTLGFVSPRFVEGPVGAFLIRGLENLDRRVCRIVCYADSIEADAMTARFQAVAHLWHQVAGLSDEELARAVRADGVDVLFDLAGHAPRSRLLAFARKPAPIQITWIDSVGTTGLAAMDFVLADRHTIPVECEPFYSEKVLRMPEGYVALDPPADAPPVGPLPAARLGHVTFGAFHNPAKLNRQVLELWSRILLRVPGSRLVLKYEGLDAPGSRRHYTELFAAWGVAAERLELEGRSPLAEYLQRYNAIDVALDPFPHSGGLTTCHAMWMGVPVVTCPGPTLAGRQTLSHLQNVGLTETVADSLAEYVELAVTLAGDLVRLAEIRAGLRGRVARSPLCDGRRFAADLMQLLRGLWRDWCAGPGRREALHYYRRAVEVRPDRAETRNNLGGALHDLGRLDAAIACYQRALELSPDCAEAHANLGVACKDQGAAAEAIECLRRALELKPELAPAQSNLLATLAYCDGVTPQELAAAHAEYDRRHAAPLRAAWRPHENPPDPDRPLRVGFVSPDFHNHPVGYFCIRALENLDRRAFEVACYSDRIVADAMTARFQAASSVWRDTAGLSDEQLSREIRRDRIDVLVDLAGHTAGNRLLALARRPAPVQITWLGYEGTTGLEAIDYLIADRHLVPAGAESHYREQILRLPDGYVCYDPPRSAPPVGPLPAAAAGHVTFAAFHNPAKITPAVVAVWSQLLTRLPGARLILKSRGGDTAGARSRLARLFAAGGIGPERLEFLGESDYGDYLAAYNRVDVALDPFPFNGGATTCDALWMGVPVVTCPGETFAGRHSLGHLSTVGLTETIAGNLAEYVDLAVKLAGDLPRLAALRAGLRGRVAGSPLVDGRRFADNLGALLRGVWRRWCQSQHEEE